MDWIRWHTERDIRENGIVTQMSASHRLSAEGSGEMWPVQNSRSAADGLERSSARTVAISIIVIERVPGRGCQAGTDVFTVTVSLRKPI